MIPALLQPLKRTLQRRQRQDKVILCKATIVDHAAERRLVPAFLRLLTVRIDRVDDDIATGIVAIASRFVAETDHLACDRVELWMCGESRRFHLAVEIISTDRFQRDRVHCERWSVLFHGEQHASPEDDVSVRCRSNHTFDQLVVREQVPIATHKCPSMLRLVQVALGLDVSLLEIDMAVLNSDGGHGAVTVEVDVVFEDGRVAVVWLYAVECAVDLSTRRDEC